MRHTNFVALRVRRCAIEFEGDIFARPQRSLVAPMPAWFEAQYRAFLDSYDPDETVAGSSPIGVAVAVATLAVAVLVLGYAPLVPPQSQVKYPTAGVVLVLVAGATTAIAYRHRCRGRIGSAATLLDNALWSGAIVFAAATSGGNVSIGLALVNALIVLMVTVRFYGLTLLFGLALVAPNAVLLIAFQPPMPVILVVASTTVTAIVMANTTAHRRTMARRTSQLEQALGAADRAADESMQAALATMLLSMGHFVHELRNCQTAVTTNLAYIESTCELSEPALEALRDVKESLAMEQRLVATTIDGLRKRGQPIVTAFALEELVQRAANTSPLPTVVTGSAAQFQLNGNPEHLSIVLQNLLRNAAQAGAMTAYIDLSLDSEGRCARLVVHDNGPGITPERRASLFAPFGDTSRAEGTGLGLYLCRRYVGLFGGTIGADTGKFGGAAFDIRLPGRDAAVDSSRRS